MLIQTLDQRPDELTKVIHTFRKHCIEVLVLVLAMGFPSFMTRVVLRVIIYFNDTLSALGFGF
jgi:hypothetical protein